MEVFDSHFHIIDYRFKVVENHGYRPPEFTTLDYKAATCDLNVIGGAIVSGSFQAFEQEYLKSALMAMGQGYYGVANIPSSITDPEIQRLSESNIVAVRFNLVRGGSEGLDHLEYLSNRLYNDFGWHTELYVDSKDLKALRKILISLKAFSIDHLGLSKAGQEELLYWADKGVKIKATGFGRIDFEPIELMKRIYKVNPDALMFGTDLPSTRARMPFSKRHMEWIKENFDPPELKRIFSLNAQNWYKKG